MASIMTPAPIQYLIIGSSHAGLAAQEAIRMQDPEGSLTMVTREADLPYSPTILPYVVAGQTAPDRIQLRGEEDFHRQQTELIRNAEAVAVQPASKTVTLSTGQRLAYDKLLLATGADAAVPAFEGIEDVPYHVVRTIADARKLRSAMAQAKSAIVLGAGLIAMHSAENLAQAGLQVTMVVRRQVSLFSYFDPDAAAMVERIYADHGVNIATGSGVQRIEAQGNRCRVILQSDQALNADLLVLATGIRPRVGFLADSGIELDRGVLVDNSMRTSIGDIWAAGDVAQAPGFFDPGRTIQATLPNASVQGRIAGMDMTADPALKPYPGSSGLNTFNFFGNHAFSLGLATASDDQAEIQINTHFLPSSRQYLKLVFRGDCLVGVSAINARLDPGVLRELIQRQIDLKEIKPQFTREPLETGRLLMSRLWR